MLALALLYSALGYVTGAVPFPAQKRGELVAADLCSSLGDGDRAAAALNAVLPTRRDYSSYGENPPRARDDTSWRADCRVYGDGDQLLYPSTELGYDASADTWLADRTRNYVDDEGRGDEFRAGNAAVVMERTAQILVACVPRGGSHQYQLVVEVRAQEPLAGSAEENHRALASVALATAHAAHRRAECPLPSKLPPTVTGW